MLNALSVSLAGADANGVGRAERSIVQQGFVPAGRFPWSGGSAKAWAHPSQRDVADVVAESPIGAAFCVGPIWYRGQFGACALELLLAEVSAGGAMDESALRGNHALFLRAGGRCILMNDALGFVRIYRSADGMFHSTSWLATCAYAGAPDLDGDAAIEYVLLGAAHSDRTPARGVTILPLGRTLDLERSGSLMPRPLAFGIGEPAATTLGEAVDRISTHLRTVFDEVVAAFPGRTRAALSGGFDSRLIVAGLLAAGARFELFVYGDGASEDVRIARAVAESIGAGLDVVDKVALDRGRSAPALDQLVENARFCDGLPTDGVLDAGSDRSTRLAQTANGWLAMNGGGGEIFRNYFHLPDRVFRPIDVVRTFYRGFDRSVFRCRGGLDRYQEGMVASMRKVIGVAEGGSKRSASAYLTRQHVELLYPLFRCHFWMAVNNSIAVRHGYYTTPLADLVGVQMASSAPLAWKNAGLLEARLITALDRTVANQPSAYGFRFSDGPDRRAKRAEWAMAMRPVILRPAINALRRRLHGLGVSIARVAECRRMLPGEWRIDPLLDLARLPDEGALRRALSIEVVWRRIVAT